MMRWYECDNCGETRANAGNIWSCEVCDKEICIDCGKGKDKKRCEDCENKPESED